MPPTMQNEPIPLSSRKATGQDPADATHAEETPFRRQNERYVVRLTALAHCHGRFQTVRILDYSMGGLQLQGGFGICPGDDVIVELLSGDRLESKAAWSVGSRVGVRFQSPLTTDNPALAVFEHAALRATERDCA